MNKEIWHNTRILYINKITLFNSCRQVVHCKCFSGKLRRKVFNFCVKSSMLYAAETWPMTEEILRRLTPQETYILRCATEESRS